MTNEILENTIGAKAVAVIKALEELSRLTDIIMDMGKKKKILLAELRIPARVRLYRKYWFYLVIGDSARIKREQRRIIRYWCKNYRELKEK